MADTAAHLVDRVFPRVAVRQWVLSFPHDLRYRLAYDARLVTDVLGIFTKTIFTSLVIDGVYAADDDDKPHFQVLPSPDDAEIVRLTESLAARIRKFLQQRGLGPDSDPEESDPLSRDQPWLAGVCAASVLGRVAYGANSGVHVTRVGGDRIGPENMDAFSSPRCAAVDGFSVHANVAVPAGDRARLERLAQYCARPPVAMDRLEVLADGRLLYRFKRAWRDGRTHIVLTPLEMLEKLSALIPAPRAHAVRYAGIFAPAAKWRALIVPDAAVTFSIMWPKRPHYGLTACGQFMV